MVSISEGYSAPACLTTLSPAQPPCPRHGTASISLPPAPLTPCLCFGVVGAPGDSPPQPAITAALGQQRRQVVVWKHVLRVPL